MQTWTRAKISEAKIAAMKLINDFAIQKPEDILLPEIAASQGVFVLEEGLHGAEARLARKGKYGIIRIRNDIPELGRRRFALGHELGHWVLHPRLSQIEYCSNKEIDGYVNSEPELTASAFAAELLMPAKIFRPRCLNVDPGLEVIKDLATDFSTTLTATTARFVEECRDGCVAIFSENGVIKRWVKRENNSPPVWFRSRQVIGEGAIARICMSGGQAPSTMTPVPCEAWFPEIPAVREVWEQSIKLGNYATILTLLWIRQIE
jgi:Zn-dependent peptidase ImmA (M78 family)